MATATEPVGGNNGTKRSPQRVMTFTMLTTILPASSARSSLTVLTAPSHGVATTTRSAPAASPLVPGEMAEPMSPHRFVSSATVAAALSSLRDPTTTSTPTEAMRAARAEPAGRYHLKLLFACYLHRTWLHRMCLHRMCLHRMCLHRMCLHRMCLHRM